SDLYKDSAELPKVNQLLNIRRAYKETRERRILPLMEAGKTEEAMKIYLGEQLERYQTMRNLTKQLGESATNQESKSVEESKESVSTTRSILLFSLLIALVLNAILGYYISGLIAAPLKTVADAAAKIAEGDLNVDLPEENRGDEVGALVKNFRRMTLVIREMAIIAG